MAVLRVMASISLHRLYDDAPAVPNLDAQVVTVLPEPALTDFAGKAK